MLKMFKYIKDSWLSILAIIVLLALQAICDLSLPDYTSKIVNVGISQGGIDEIAPIVIRESEMNKILLLLSEEDQKIVLSYYTLLETENISNQVIKKYPLLATENIHEKKKTNKKENEELSSILQTPILMVSALDGTREDTASMRDLLLGELPSDTDIFVVLQNMPSEARNEMIKEVSAQMEQIPESILTSGAIQVIRQEYMRVGINTDKIQTNYIFVAGAKMLGIALFSMITTILVGLLGARLASKLAHILRKKVFEKVVSFSSTEMKQFGTSSLITRTTNDIQQMQFVLVMLLRTVFYAPIIGIGGVIKSINANSSMAWIIAVAVMSILTLVIVLFAIVMPKFKIVQKLVDRLNLVTREILTGLPVIRAFHNEKHEEERFDKANKDLTKLSLFVGRTMSFMMPAMMFIMNTVALVILWKGAYSIDA